MRIFQTLCAVAIILLTVFACSNDDKDEPILKSIDSKTISAKWLSSDQQAEYTSFEFNQNGHYIAVQRSYQKSAPGREICHFGEYRIIDGKTVQLDNLGTITITKMSDNELVFTFVDKSNFAYNLNTHKAPNMKESSRTQLLCRTWEIKTYNGEEAKGTEHEGTVLFSQAGTYFVTLPNTIDGGGGLAKWWWMENSNESKMAYSWAEDGEMDWYVDILELTSTALKIKETDRETDEVDIYELHPLVATKSLKAGSFENISFGNFFGKPIE